MFLRPNVPLKTQGTMYVLQFFKLTYSKYLDKVFVKGSKSITSNTSLDKIVLPWLTKDVNKTDSSD